MQDYRPQIKAAKMLVERLQAQFSKEMRGRVVPSTRALAIARQVKKAQTALEALEAEERDQAAILTMPFEKVLNIVSIPVLMDIANAVCAEIDGDLRRHGAAQTIFAERIRALKKEAVDIVSTMDFLPAKFETSDTLIEAVHKKILSFLKTAYKKSSVTNQ